MTAATFTKTPRQVEALDLANHHRHTLLYGGSRSGKTAILVRNTFLRALKFPSRHLLTRFRFNHAKVSLWYDTVPKVLRLAFPGVRVKENKADWFWELDVPGSSEKSQVWLGGIDDKDRVEKVLGNEYSTIHANECSQMSYEAIYTLRTRLAENVGLPLRFYYDENPPSRKHWSHSFFLRGENPDGTKHGLNTCNLQMNPVHNEENLSPEYIEELKGLPERARKRYLEGLFLTDVEGALWSDEMITAAKLYQRREMRESVVAVDPSVKDDGGGDECGIMVCGVDENWKGGIIEDLSGNLSPKTWAQRTVNAFHQHQCSCVVAEGNQGGALVADVIHNVDPYVPVKIVYASRSKWARAEPVAQLYELGEVWHEGDMPELEEELTTYVPKDSAGSPNRLDAAVWGLTHLVVGDSEGEEHFG